MQKQIQRIKNVILANKHVAKLNRWANIPRDFTITGQKPDMYVNWIDKSGVKNYIPSPPTLLACKTVLIYWTEFAIWGSIVFISTGLIAKVLFGKPDPVYPITLELLEFKKQWEEKHPGKGPLRNPGHVMAESKKPFPRQVIDFILPCELNKKNIVHVGLCIYLLPWVLRQTRQRVATMSILKRRLTLAKKKYERLRFYFHNFEDKKPPKYYHPPQDNNLL